MIYKLNEIDIEINKMVLNLHTPQLKSQQSKQNSIKIALNSFFLNKLKLQGFVNVN